MEGHEHIGYELKKLCGVKYLFVFLAALLCINCVIAFFTANKAQPQGISSQEISEFYDYYFKNTSEAESIYEEMIEFEEQQNELFRIAMRNGDMNFEPEMWQNRSHQTRIPTVHYSPSVKSHLKLRKIYRTDMQNDILAQKQIFRNLSQWNCRRQLYNNISSES